MRHRNSVFHDLLKRVPWAAFERLVAEHGSDEGTRSFTSRQHLAALLFAQLSGASSLREIEATMMSHQGRLYHCGAVAPKRSTFADANRARDFRIFSGLFEAMLAQAGRGFRRKMADAVRLIDSTGLRLAGVGAEWAGFSTDVFGAKAHVVYDPDLGRPVYHAVTAANVNDISAAKELSSAARPAADRQRNPRLPRTRSTRARQSHAPKRRRSTPKSPAAPAARLATTPTPPDPNLNRTAVGLTRPSTWSGGLTAREWARKAKAVQSKWVSQVVRMAARLCSGSAWMAATSAAMTLGLSRRSL